MRQAGRSRLAGRYHHCTAPCRWPRPAGLACLSSRCRSPGHCGSRQDRWDVRRNAGASGMAKWSNPTGGRLLLTPIALALGVSGFALPGEASGEPDVLTALVVRVVAPPNPVLGADNKIHLAYELQALNQSPVLITIDSIKVLDPTSGAVLQDLSGAGVAKISRFPGGTGATLPPSHSGYVFMDVMLPAGAAAPKEIAHRFEATRQLPRSPEDPHHGVPVTAESGVEPAEAFTGVATAVRPPALTLPPPLKRARSGGGGGFAPVRPPR